MPSGCATPGGRWWRGIPSCGPRSPRLAAARPHQVVLDRVEMPWHEEDWRDRTPDQQDRAPARLPRRRSPARLRPRGAAADADRAAADGRPRTPADLEHPPSARGRLVLAADLLGAVGAVRAGAGRVARPRSRLRVSRVRRVAPAARRGSRRRLLARRAERRRRSDADSRGSREPGRRVGSGRRSHPADERSGDRGAGRAGAQPSRDARRHRGRGVERRARASQRPLGHRVRRVLCRPAGRHPRHRDDGRSVREQPADPRARATSGRAWGSGSGTCTR